MKINGIVLSSIIITNIIVANPNNTASERISSSEALLGLHPGEDITDMRIQGTLLSSLIITNILSANPNDIEAESKWIGSGEVLLGMLSHPDVVINMFGNVYIRGVASGLGYNSYIVDWMAEASPGFKNRVKQGLLLQLPNPVDWSEVTNVVYQYLLHNPGALELPSVLLIENALHQVYGGINNEDE